MSDVSRCAHCGAFVQREDRFCWSCGADLRQQRQPPKQPLPPLRESDRAAELAIRRAYLAQQRGDLAEATLLVREALERSPKSAAALSLLSELLRAKGDLVGAVEAADRATEAADAGGAAPGALAAARRERAEIQEQVVRELGRESGSRAAETASVFAASGEVWYQSGPFYVALAGAGLVSLFLALVAVFRGQLPGYLWLAASFSAAGWCYWDAETRRGPALFWGPVVLCLGPFGLAVYLLTRD